MTYRHWTTAEVATVRELYGRTPMAQIAATVKRGVSSVQSLVKRMGLAPAPVTINDIVKLLYAGHTAPAIAKRLGVDPQTVRLRVKTHRPDLVDKLKSNGRKARNRQRLSKREQKYISDNAETMTIAALAVTLDRSQSTIRSHLRRRP